MRCLHAVLAIVLAAGLAACSFTRPPLERATYDLAPARGTPPAGAAKGVVLKVKPFRTTPPYEGREFQYRRADGQLVADFYHGFSAGPGELVTAAAADWLTSSGLFSAVLQPGISADSTYSLEGSVIAVYGDVRDPQRPAAVLEVQTYLIRTAPAARELVLDRRFAERVAVAEATPAAFAKGYSEALARILARLERELAAVDFKR